MRARFQDVFNPNLKMDKKEPYSNINLDPYKVRIDEPSKSLTVLRYQHGYFANQTVHEAKQMFNNFGEKLSNKFGGYCH